MFLIIILCIVTILFMYTIFHITTEPFSEDIFEKENPRQYLHRVINTPMKKNQIFISVASYRDDLCVNTCKSIFDNADIPEHIRIGICQQNNENDLDCSGFGMHEDKVNIVRLPSSAAQGPTYARYVCSKLWRGEEYYMQIDSHMIFVKSWDTKLINMIQDCLKLSSKPMLTHYPLSISQYENNVKTVPYMCNSKWNDNGMIQLYAELKKVSKVPRFSPYAASGFFFSKSSFLKEVPYDPHLPFLFQGEEILHSARLWTNGWDFFQPTDNVIIHYYKSDNEDKNLFWEEHKEWYKDEKESLKRAKYILQLSDTIDTKYDFFKRDVQYYGLGTTRTIEEYFKFAGIDPIKLTTKSKCAD